MIVAAISTQASTQVPQGMLQSYRGGVAARKALEIAGAYATKGHLLAKPQYFDYCEHFSTQDEYVLCALQNSQSTCKAWAKAGPEGIASTATNATFQMGPYKSNMS